MKKFILVLVIVVLVTFLLMGCLPVTPGEGEGEGESEVTVVIDGQWSSMARLMLRLGHMMLPLLSPLWWMVGWRPG